MPHFALFIRGRALAVVSCRRAKAVDVILARALSSMPVDEVGVPARHGYRSVRAAVGHGHNVDAPRSS